MNAYCCIDILNDDSLIYIFEFLSVKDRFKIEFINKRFNMLSKISWCRVSEINININNSFVKEILITDKNKITSFCLQIFSRSHKYLNEITLDGYLVHGVNWTKVIKNIANTCENLKKISFFRIDMSLDILNLFVKNNRQLISITFNDIDTLNFTSCLLNKHILNLELIEEFNLINCKINSEELFNLFLSKLKNIKILHIDLNYLIFNLDFVLNAIIVGNINNLNDLSLNGYIFYDTVKLSKVIEKQKDLKSLSLEKIDNYIIRTLDIYVNIFEHIINEIKINITIDKYLLYKLFFINENLKIFSFFIEEINNEDFDSISKCKFLKSINITTYKYKATDLGISYISKNLSYLENFQLTLINSNNIIKNDTYLNLSHFNKMNNLKNLIIKGFNFNEEVNLNFKNLKLFHVSTSMISNKFMVKIILNSIKLEKCIINRCKNIDKNFNNLFNKMKNNVQDHSVKLIIEYSDNNELNEINFKKIYHLY